MAGKDEHQHERTKKDVHPDWGDDKRWAPLTAGFMITSIVGFFISVLYVRKFSISMAIAFAVVFSCMFFASLIAMEHASPDAQLAARPIK
jgi:hypothetical protein